MRIGIVGGGSIGLLFAYYLSKSFPITIYTRSSAQAGTINREGVWLKKNDELYHADIQAMPFADWKASEQLSIITVKQYDLEEVLYKASQLSLNEGALLFLQNGMGHLNMVTNLVNNRIYMGSVEHGAYRTKANSVNHNGVGVTKVAVYRGGSTLLKTFLSNIPPEFPFVFEEDYYEMLTKKLVVNALINPLTAVLNVKNGQLIENPHYLGILKEVFTEINHILDLVDKDDYWNHVINVCKKTALNQSSMLKDLAGHQPTEVDAILGYLLKKAEGKRYDSSLVRTFYQLIKGKEYEGRNVKND